VAEVLPDKEGIGSLLDHQHGSGVPARLLYRRCAERGSGRRRFFLEFRLG